MTTKPKQTDVRWLLVLEQLCRTSSYVRLSGKCRVSKNHPLAKEWSSLQQYFFDRASGALKEALAEVDFLIEVLPSDKRLIPFAQDWPSTEPAAAENLSAYLVNFYEKGWGRLEPDANLAKAVHQATSKCLRPIKRFYPTEIFNTRRRVDIETDEEFGREAREANLI